VGAHARAVAILGASYPSLAGWPYRAVGSTLAITCGASRNSGVPGGERRVSGARHGRARMPPAASRLQSDGLASRVLAAPARPAPSPPPDLHRGSAALGYDAHLSGAHRVSRRGVFFEPPRLVLGSPVLGRAWSPASSVATVGRLSLGPRKHVRVVRAERVRRVLASFSARRARCRRCVGGPARPPHPTAGGRSTIHRKLRPRRRFQDGAEQRASRHPGSGASRGRFSGGASGRARQRALPAGGSREGIRVIRRVVELRGAGGERARAVGA